jgi:nucleotide-binding universal stress UspA family protein
MQKILVPVSGAAHDDLAMKTALALARPFNSHVEFLHIRLGAAEAAMYTPHMEFARGAAMTNALHALTVTDDTRAAHSESLVRSFCQDAKLRLCVEPTLSDTAGPTACWREEHGHAVERILFHARHSDLTVLNRAKDIDGLPRDRIERLLMESGRPIVLTGDAPPDGALLRVAVCWKETPNAARAVASAMPLLKNATAVLVLTVAEGTENFSSGVNALVDELAWHGIAAKARVIDVPSAPTAQELIQAARQSGAGLAVMGGFGHSVMREIVFGGCTQAILDQASLPVWLMH